jgi:protocatechuate 3,4-dioxygenase beta subunit
MPPGIHEMTASAEGHADRRAELKQGDAGDGVQDFALDPAMSVVVTVVGEDGRPIAGARVVPSDADMDGAFHLDRGTDTDAEGKALVHKVSRTHPQVIKAYKEGYRSPDVRPQAGPEETLAEAKIVLERNKMKDRVIAGSVTDAAGRPIAGATVEWKDGQGTAFGDGVTYGQFKAVTGRDGRYRLAYEDDYDECDLGVAAPGWAPLVRGNVRPGTPAEPAEANFTLEPAHWLAGRVVDEESQPLVGARIVIMPALHLLNPAVAYPAVIRQAKTDAEGRFRLEDLPGPKAAIELRAPDQRPPKETEIEMDREVDLVMEGYGVIRGRVTDAETGEPIPVFTVRQSLDMQALSFTAPDGRFVLERLPRGGSVKVGVEAEGYVLAERPDVAPQAAAKAEEAAFALQRGRPLEGVIVDAATGAPVAGAQVLATASERAGDFLALDWDAFRFLRELQKTVTGGDGVFRFIEGKPASLLVRATGRRRLFIQPQERAAYALPDGRLRIPLVVGERLRGVYHQDGRPVQGVDVHLWLEGPELPREGRPLPDEAFARTDADGKFGWDHLVPGPYIVEVTRKVSARPRDLEIKIRRRVAVEPGVEATVDLGKGVGTATLGGRVTGMGDRESVWAVVVLTPLDGAGDELSFKTYRDWDWRFVCPFLRPGKYDVEVQFYTREGTRAARLPAIEVAGDGEQDLAMPAER